MADVILYDALLDKSLLDRAKPNALKIFVGKRHGFKAYQQFEINELLRGYASEQLRVVRLKGGDPFVFGRGAEEMNYLEENGIETEIIPGPSSVTAVPTHHGIPLTKRGINQSFWVLTATTSEGEISEDLTLAAQSSATLVILMGIKKFDRLAQLLLKFKNPLTPLAVIQNGTYENEQILLSTLTEYESISSRLIPNLPGIILVGDTIAEHPSFLDETIQRVLSNF